MNSIVVKTLIRTYFHASVLEVGCLKSEQFEHYKHIKIY